MPGRNAPQRHDRRGGRPRGGSVRRSAEWRFAFRLARHLGLTVGELVARMSAEEFTAWRGLDAWAPIGDERADRHAALIATILANVNRDPKREPFTLDDFDLYRERRPLTRAEEEARFRAAFQDRGLVRYATE